MKQRLGESVKDRDRRAAGVIFRDTLGMCSRSVVFTRINYIDLAPFISFGEKVNLPWRRWVDLAAKEELCIIDWVDGLFPPGPDFEIKKFGAIELRRIAGSYIDFILKGKVPYEVFSVIRWSPGVWSTAVTIVQY